MPVKIDQKPTGRTMTLSFTVLGKATECPELTEPIIVNGLAMIRFKFEYVCEEMFCLVSRIMLKKTDNAKASTFKICVTCENLEKEWICTDDWAEYELISKKRDSFTMNIISCTLEVNVTVEEIRRTLMVKLCEDTEYTDFHLQAADGTVAVHKCVMSLQSDVFRKMLTGEWKETTEGVITLAGLTVRTLQHLKDYMYMGILPDDGLEMLLLVADCYMIENLKADCIHKLVETVTSANIDNLIEFACQNNVPDLVRHLIYQFPHRIENGFFQLKADNEQENETKFIV